LKLNRYTRIQFVCFALFLLLASMFMSLGFAAASIQVTINSSRMIGVNNFSVGFQLDGPDIRIWRDRSVLRELAEEANFKLVRFFEHRLGKPCTYWDESTKTGRWDWTDLDLLIQRIFESGAEPLIALGFVGYASRRLTSAPSGMSYDRNTDLPYPDQWAAYCAEWVRHFKEVDFPVRYYEIINEAYHYFGWPATQPKLGYFMNLYNAAAKAMRIENSNVKIGNDACILETVLDYFISTGENLDFLSYHAYGTESLSATDSEIFNAAETKYIGETRDVYGVDKTRQLYKVARGIDLPVIHGENNVNFQYSQGTDPRIQKMQGAVYQALTFRTSMLKNFLFNTYFHFASSASQEERNPSGGLGFGMVNSDNNQPWYPYYVHEMVGNNLAVGDTLVESSSDSNDLRVVAWIHEDKLNAFLICKVDQQRTIYLRGLTGQLDYFKIDNTISWKTPTIQTGTIDSADFIALNGYTVMLLQGEVSAPPPPPPPPPPSVFEDGFESGDFSKWTGTTTSSGESALVVDTLPHHGTHHGQFTSNGGSDSEHAYCYKMIDKEELYARGYFYVAGDLPLTDNEDRFYFIRFTANDQSLTGAGIRRNGGVDSWILYARDGTGLIGPFYAPSPVVEEYRWYCVELYWKKAVSYGLVEMYVDGEKVLEVTNIDTADSGNVDEVDFGLVSATNVQNRLTVYGDCFALSDTYIGPETNFALFEDGFESGDFGAWSGLTVTSGDDATVTQASSCYGEYGANFQTYSIASGTKRACVYKNIDESSVVYARGYFYIAEGLPLVDTDDRFTLLQFLGSDENIICNLQVRRVQGEDRFAILAFTGDMQTTTAVYPTSYRWYCLELFAQIHATEGAFKAYIDSVERLSLTSMDTTMLGNIFTIRFGLANSINVQHEVVVYGDKAVFSTSYNGLLYPWDLNKDRVVDLLDFTIVMSCYGATPESPSWNQLADLKVDGIIDVYDAVIVCYHYGEKY